MCLTTVKVIKLRTIITLAISVCLGKDYIKNYWSFFWQGYLEVSGIIGWWKRWITVGVVVLLVSSGPRPGPDAAHAPDAWPTTFTPRD